MSSGGGGSGGGGFTLAQAYVAIKEQGFGEFTGKLRDAQGRFIAVDKAASELGPAVEHATAAAGHALDGMAAKAKAAIGKLKDVVQEAGGKGRGLFASLFDFSGLMPAAMGVGVGLGAGILVKMAADAEESKARFSRVFSGLSAGAEGFANDYATSIRRSAGDVRETMIGLQRTMLNMDFTPVQSLQMTRELTRLSFDYAAAWKTSADQAAEVFGRAMLGETRGLREFGIVLKDTAIREQLLKQGFRGTVEQASDQQRSFATLAALMELSKRTGIAGNAGIVSDSLTSELTALYATIKRFAISVGELFKPVIKEIVEAAESIVESLNLGGMLAGWSEAIGAFFSPIIHFIRDEVLLVIDDFKNGTVNSLSLIKNVAGEFFAWVLEWVGRLGDWLGVVIDQKIRYFMRQMPAIIGGGGGKLQTDAEKIQDQKERDSALSGKKEGGLAEWAAAAKNSFAGAIDAIRNHAKAVVQSQDAIRQEAAQRAASGALPYFGDLKGSGLGGKMETFDAAGDPLWQHFTSLIAPKNDDSLQAAQNAADGIGKLVDAATTGDGLKVTIVKGNTSDGHAVWGNNV